jgi:hypothetical protein
MMVIGGVALVAGALALFRESPSPAPSGDGAGLTRLSAKPLGNTAISHGGPAPVPIETNDTAGTPGKISVGQRVVVGEASGSLPGTTTPIPLLVSAPDHESRAHSPSSGAARSVAPGTVVLITGVFSARRTDTGFVEPYYEIQLPDGVTGWLPERVLHAVTEQAGKARN